jgi:hypothetical protein
MISEWIIALQGLKQTGSDGGPQRVMFCPRGDSGSEHDPEKWEPVFRKDHAQTKS